MNWIKNSTFHTFVLHLTLLFSVCTLSIHAQEYNPVIDKTGLLTIGTEDTKEELTLNSDTLDDLIDNQEPPEDEDDSPTGLRSIRIEKEGTLVIAKDTDVELKGSLLDIYGKLIINLDENKKGLHGLIENDDEGQPKPPKTIGIKLDGGTITIQDAGSGTEAELDADITLGAHGGTIDIADGLTYTIGEINLASSTAGDFIKDGNGNLVVDTVKVGGTFKINAGDVHFSNNATVGKLMSEDVGTIISGQRGDDETTKDTTETDFMLTALTVSKGGKFAGTLQEIGALVLGDGSTSSSLELISGVEHTDIGYIQILKNATLDLQAGKIQLAADPAIVEPDDTDDEDDAPTETESVDLGDIVIQGTLQIADTADIFKQGEEPKDTTDFKVTLSGSTDSEGNMSNGVIKVVPKDTESPSSAPIDHSDMQVQIYGGGGIDVAEGLTLKTGSVNFIEDKKANITGGTLYVSGGGTYETESVNLGTGWLVLKKDTTMNVIGSSEPVILDSEEETLPLLQAGLLLGEEGSIITAKGNADAEFDYVGIPLNGYEGYVFDGTYDGEGNNLTIKEGGRITGHLTGIGELNLSGDYLLKISPSNPEGEELTYSPIISADKLVLDEKTTIRVIQMESDFYEKIFEVTDMDEESKSQLEDALNAGVETALYRPTWEVDDDGNVNLDLEVLSVDDYVSSHWHKEGTDVAAAALLLETLAGGASEFRIHLEGLSDAQLQGGLKTIMAGKLAGNALQMALRPPAQSVFRHLDTVMPLRSPFSRSNYRGQIREGYNVWFNPFGQSETADSGGNPFDGYDMTRFGFHLGGDIEIYNRAVLGALFSYSNPQLSSELGKVTANDYTAGVYLRMPTAWAVVANLMIGFGNQDYTYENYLFDTDFRGGSFFASAELTRPVSFQTFQLTPLIAFDYQSAEMDTFILANQATGWTLVAPEEVSQTALRIGMLGNAGRFRARIQYTRLLSGDDSVASRTAAGSLSASTVIHSSEWGKDWINVGVGGELFTMRYWRLFADYNFDVGKHTTSHTGSLNAVLTW